jgi:hypothetical protein
MEVTSNSITNNTPSVFSPPWKCVPKRKTWEFVHRKSRASLISLVAGSRQRTNVDPNLVEITTSYSEVKDQPKETMVLKGSVTSGGTILVYVKENLGCNKICYWLAGESSTSPGFLELSRPYFSSLWRRDL